MRKGYLFTVVYSLVIFSLSWQMVFSQQNKSFPDQALDFNQKTMIKKMENLMPEIERMPKERFEVLDIKKEIPQGKFIFPKEQEKLKEKINLLFEIKDALEVEFLIRRPEALVPNYLGKAEKKENNLWQLSWETNSLPNGNYFLIGRVKNEFGRYETGKILIRIENQIEKDLPKIEIIKREIEKKETQIEKKEKEIEKQKEKAKGEIKQTFEELKIEIEKQIPKIEKEKIEKTKEKAKELIEKVVERKIIKKELEEKKKEIEEKVVEIKKIAEKEEKTEILEKTEKARLAIDQAIKKAIELAKEKERIEKERIKLLSKDTDKDGIPDKEEIRLKTDPLNPDSDRDGFLDGSELKLGFDPLNPLLGEKIKFQDPRKVPPKKADILKVEKVSLIDLPTKKRGLKIEGKALPNVFVTIYIFSLPTIVMTKADSQGKWVYVLDKPLADGQHTIYAALTNNKGEIEGKSEAFVFIKKRDTILRLFEERKEVKPSIEILQRNFLLLVAALVVFSLGLALFIIGLLLIKRSRQIEK